LLIEYHLIFTAVCCSAVVIMHIDHLNVFGFQRFRALDKSS